MLIIFELFFTLIFASPFETTVSANRFLKNPTTSQNIIIQSEQLKSFQTFDQVLMTVPELNINRTGSMGSQTTVSFRGQKLSHVLFLIDGIPVNDPSTVDRQFNPAFIDLKSIERIEIIKGAQSVMYGSQAIAGVINLVTRRGGANQFHLEQDVGSYQTFKSLVGRSDENYFISFERDGADGFSHVKGNEKDGFENLILNYNYYNRHFQFLLKSMNSTNEEDGGAKDNDDYTKSLFDLMTLKYKFDFSKGSLIWQPSYVASRRRSFSGSDVYHFTGRTWRNDIYFYSRFKYLSWIIGSTYEIEALLNQDLIESNTINSYYTSFNFEKSDNLAEIGVRLDDHQLVGNINTYQVGLGRKIGTGKLTLGQKTAFKTPTLYQLYAEKTPEGKIGNENLDSEISRSYELNFDQESFRSSLYIIEQKDLIAFNSDDGFVNVDKRVTRGFDIFKTFVDRMNEFGAGTTILWWESEDQIEKQPQQKFNGHWIYKWNDYYHLNLNATWIGQKVDQGQQIDSYDLWDISLTRFFQTSSLQLAVNNLFNKDFTESYGFQTPGQVFNVNFRISL